MTPIKAIRAKCMNCVCDQANEIKLCPITDCPLYPFRFGKNPNKKANLTDEQRSALSERGKNLAALQKSKALARLISEQQD